jgi:hypothetical protein
MISARFRGVGQGVLFSHVEVALHRQPSMIVERFRVQEVLCTVHVDLGRQGQVWSQASDQASRELGLHYHCIAHCPFWVSYRCLLMTVEWN